MGTVQRAVLTDDQLVLAQIPEATNKLLDVGDTVERMDDEGQPGPILSDVLAKNAAQGVRVQVQPRQMNGLVRVAA